MMVHIELVLLLGVVIICFTEAIDICGIGKKWDGTKFTVRQLPNLNNNEGAHGCQCTIEAKDNLSLLTNVTFSYQPGSGREQPSGCPPLLRWEEESIYNCARMRSDNKTNESGNDGGDMGGNDNYDGGHGYANESHVHQRNMTQGEVVTFRINNPGDFNLQMKVDIAATNGKLVSISCQQYQQTVSDDVCPCPKDPKIGAFSYSYHCHVFECHFGWHAEYGSKSILTEVLSGPFVVIIVLFILYGLYEWFVKKGRGCGELYRSCMKWLRKKDKTAQATPEELKELEEI